jgi:hypothetical protein
MGRAAAERHAILSLALLFRKFIVPGIQRRYKKNSYVERVQDYTEGYYRTTARYLSSLVKEVNLLGLVLQGEEWNKLSRMEKSNIKRTVGDIAWLVTAIIVAGLFKGLGDDDDEWIYSFGQYEMQRFQTELLFFTPKIDESMTILQSPFASMSLLINTGKFIGQLADPTERNKTGDWKGHLKLEKLMWNYVPVMKSFYSTRDIKSQLGIFTKY